MSIPEQIIEEVRQRSNFVALAADWVSVKRAGKTFQGLCPFHSEKSPSFHINEDEKLFHCFGCGKSGSIFQFIMELRGMSFPEAVRFLAEKAGVRIPENNSASTPDSSTVLRKVMKEVVGCYRSQLLDGSSGSSARNYLQSRGIGTEISELYALGYAPERWSFIREAVLSSSEGSWEEAELNDALNKLGLIRQSKNEGDERTYDFFRGRLLFPISRSDGSPIALGGRVLRPDDKAPKYLNSCEHALYAKRRTLFGLAQAMPTIRKEKQTFLVEGYMDVLSMAQHGFLQTVAGCGTAVSAEHVDVLKRVCSSVVLLFDSDLAGRKAAAHCFETFINSGLEVVAVLLPDGEDPDSICRKMSRESLKAYIATHSIPASLAYLDFLRAEFLVGSTDQAAAIGRAAERYVEVLRGLRNRVELELRLKEGAERLGVEYSSLAAMVRGSSAETREPSRYQSSQSASPRAYSAASKNNVQGGRPSPTARPNPPAATVASRQQAPSTSLDPYFKQLLVAVISQPGLAGRLHQIPSLENGLGVVERLPSTVQDFLQTLIVIEADGKRTWDFEDSTVHSADSRFADLIGLCESCALPAKLLIEEALRQRRIGGTKHQDLVLEAERTTARRALKDEVLKLRQQEKDESDQAERERLIQEKLLKKRSLAKLASSGE